jgi:SAM-dependent methyltransferase
LTVAEPGFRQTVIDLKQGPATGNENQVERHAYNISYKPELELLDSATLHKLYTNSTNHELVDSVDMVDRIEMVCLWYMKRAVEGIEDTDVEKMPKTLQCYMQWLRRHYDPTRLDTFRQCSVEHDALFGRDDAREAFLSKFAKACAQGQLIVRCGENLLDILRGQIDPLDLLFADSAAATYYQNSGFPRFEGLVVPVMDMLAHENCELHILEVGAGTGCSTLPILRKLQGNPDHVDGREGISRFNKFTFTDISPSFFEPAKDKLGKLARNVDFKVFDIEKDPSLQGFEEGSYDVLIATGVLHATSNLTKTLSYVRKLIKPGGKVLLFEPTGVHLVNISFVFGLLPGWWLSTDKERTDGPMANPETWDRLLRENGFSGTEVALPDVDDSERQCYTSMLSTALPQDPTRSELCPITIVIEPNSEDQAKIAHNLSDIYSSWREVFTVSIDAIMTQETGGHCLISLVEYKNLLFDQMKESTWTIFKSMLAKNDRVIWTTCPVGPEARDIASSSLATGVIRNVNSEKMDSRWILVTLEDGSHQHHVELICKVFDYRLGPSENLRKDTEYREIGGELCTPRLVDADTVNQHVERASRSRVSRSQCFGHDPARALKLSIGAPGLLDTFEFDDDPYYERPLLETEVEIRVVAAGLDEKDVYVALGQVVNDCFGFECAGYVVRTGPKSDFRSETRFVL